MKTAMQELIEIYEYYHSFEEFNEWFMDMGKKAMLEKEKEQIEHAHAHRRCLHNKTMDCTIEAYKNAEEYYNQTYNQNEG